MKNHIQHTDLAKPTESGSIATVNGLILAGGKSKRMGTDKRLMDYHGMTQLDYLHTLLKKLTNEVYISCHPQSIPETKHKVLTDTFLDLGPYSGVLSAFRYNPNSAWLAVACDIPLLNEEIITNLLLSRDPEKIATCYHDPTTGLPEPLVTIWEPSAYPVLLQYLSQGTSCLRKALINSDVKQLHIETPESLRNANTIDEAEYFKAKLK